jgi:hypothetical protein
MVTHSFLTKNRLDLKWDVTRRLCRSWQQNGRWKPEKEILLRNTSAILIAKIESAENLSRSKKKKQQQKTFFIFFSVDSTNSKWVVHKWKEQDTISGLSATHNRRQGPC